MAVTALTDLELISSTDKIVKYPNPFFDLSANYVPKNIKTLFKFCRDYYHTNGFMNNVINKLTEYPITDIMYDSTTDVQIKAKYDEILHNKLKIKSFLIEIGLDYFTFGNSFISVALDTTRFLKCRSCNNVELFDNVSNMTLRNFDIQAECKVCSSKTLMDIQDDTIKDINAFRLIRWAPENIDIVYNGITGKSTYLYRIPAKTRAGILSSNRYILKDVPVAFLKSLKEKKDILLDPDNLFHLKMPRLADEDMGWGMPLVLPALRDIYYLQTLRRGNEAIANEHIVPKKVISPASNGYSDPLSSMNLGKWRSEVDSQLKKWKRDPNHIGIFPIPMTYQQLGGDAKLLSLTPELRFVEESIINSLGVPLEFIKGGASWTGSSISLRIIENHFLTYRELLKDFLNFFLVQKINRILGYPKVSLYFKRFKMSDDGDAKQLALNLNAAGKLSDARLLEDFGYSYDDESQAIKLTRTQSIEDTTAEMLKQAEAQGKAQIVAAEYQARAQKALEDMPVKLKMEAFEEELAQELGGIPDDPFKVVEKYANQINAMDPVSQGQTLIKIQKQMPVTYGFIIDYLMTLQAQAAQIQMPAMQAALQNKALQEEPPDAPSGKKSNAEKKPGTREGDKVKPKTSEQKAPSRGTP